MIIPNSYKCDSLLFDSLFFIGASLCILIVKMVRRKRGFQDQENQANYDPQEKRGSRRLRLIVLPLTLLTLKITMHILILFSSRPHRPVQDSILPQRSWNFTVTRINF